MHEGGPQGHQVCGERVRGPTLSRTGEVLTICSISDINKECLDQFRTHWQCLENHNQQLWNCRSEERRLNKCVFDKLVSIRLSEVLSAMC